MLYKENQSAYTRCEKCRHIDRENEECKVTNDKWLVCDDAGECRQFSQEGVNMKVRCINKVEGGTLEVGKIYDVEVVEAVGMTFYEFVNEENERCGHPAEYFEKVNDEKLDVDLSSKYHIHKEKLDKNPLEKHKKLGGISCSDAEKIADNMTKIVTREASNVDHPNHYNKGRFEVIEVIEDWDLNFSLGNTIKYIARAKHKGKEIEDLEKAMWYLSREIERVKASE